MTDENNDFETLSAEEHDHLVAQRRAGRKASRKAGRHTSMQESLNINSLMDMMTILLVYLSIAGSGDGSGYRALIGTRLQLVLLSLFLILGGALLTMYSLLVAHAMDRTVPVYVASTSVTMLFVWTAGGIVGPLLASLVAAAFGNAATSWLLAVLMAGFTLFVAVRITRASASTRAEKTVFVATEATSPEAVPNRKKK